VHDESVTRSFEVECLVEVQRAGRVDGHERDVRAVQVGQARARGSLRRGFFNGRRELGADLHLRLDLGDSLAKTLGGNAVVGGSDPDNPG